MSLIPEFEFRQNLVLISYLKAISLLITQKQRSQHLVPDDEHGLEEFFLIQG